MNKDNYLYFKVDRSSGYSLQLVINLNNRTYKRGYCIASWCDFVTLKNIKSLDEITRQLNSAGYKRIED